jgi:predicted anti-sigma-YlaC factor YlaD
MKGQFPSIPEACQRALAEIEADPLRLSPTVEAHVDRCPSCSETRIAWLAQQETEAVAPAGYFERLPDRILSKLPAGPRRRKPHLAIWAMAAAALLAVATGGFWAGRANRTPMVEATLIPVAVETHDALPDTPFQEGEDDYAQLPNLSPEQARMVIERVSRQEPSE